MDKYERVRVVGRGAFGTVYLCRRLADQREVIVKQIPVEQLSRMDRLATINEVKVLAMLQHPNVIEYYDNFIQDQAMMIVMEYAAGGTLHDYLESKAAAFTDEKDYLDEAEIANLLAQIVLPLNLVHEEHILHRDLKTQNIFLTKALNHVKIGDFGISKILSSKSKAMTVVGTPSYISPELCEGKPYNEKSDIWALGCVLYEMCTFKRAFEAPTLPALVLKIMRGNFHPLPAHYSNSLVDLVTSLLCLDPAARPSLPQVMSHHWLAPRLYRLPTSLGALPMNRKSASASRARNRTKETGAGGVQKASTASAKKRSVSPFVQEQNRRCVIAQLVGDSLQPRLISLLLPPKSADVSQLCPTSNSRVFGVTEEGKVLEWNGLPARNYPKSIDGLSGITVTKVAVGGHESVDSSSSTLFVCLITDRGILLTYGSGKKGCLGHGDRKSLTRPKIVEALLGDGVVAVACGGGGGGLQRVVALTSDNEVYVWGGDQSVNGGAERPLSSVTSRDPVLIADPSTVVRAIHCCYRATTPQPGAAIINDEGKVMVSKGDTQESLAFVTQSMATKEDSDVRSNDVIILAGGIMSLVTRDGDMVLATSEKNLKLTLPDDEKVEMQCCSSGSDRPDIVNLIVLSTSANLYIADVNTLKPTKDKPKFQKVSVDLGNAAMRIRKVDISTDKTLAMLLS